MELEEAAKREITKMRRVMESLSVVIESKSYRESNEMKKLVDAYWTDSLHFLERKMFLEAFEAAVICWAYVDAGLHIGIFEVSEDVRNLFTV